MLSWDPNPIIKPWKLNGLGRVLRSPTFKDMLRKGLQVREVEVHWKVWVELVDIFDGVPSHVNGDIR